jgi:hypothetical protein
LITHEELREREHVGLDDVLHETGLRILRAPGKSYAISPRAKKLTPGGAGESSCQMTVYLNGIRINENLELIPVSSLGAVEIFKSALEAPTQYGGLMGQCGVVLLWSRER